MRASIVLIGICLCLALNTPCWAQNQLSKSVPVNDECWAPRPIRAGLAYRGSTSGATGYTNSECGQSDSSDVWFSWTATRSGWCNATTCGSDFDTTLAVYSSACEGREITCSDEEPSEFCDTPHSALVHFQASKDYTYYFRVAGYNDATGEFTLRMNFNTNPEGEYAPEGDAPENDECLYAAPIYTDLPILANNINATGQDVSSCHMGDTNDVWFEWRPERTGWYSANTCDNTFDTTLSAFWAACGIYELACNDDQPNTLLCDSATASLINFRAAQNAVYYLRVAGHNGTSGTFSINITGALPPEGETAEGAATEGEATEGIQPEGAPAEGDPFFVQNDLSRDAITIVTGETLWGDNEYAGGTDLTSCATGDTKDVWYKWIATGNDSFTVNTCGSAFDTTLAVFPSCGDYACETSELTCSDDNAEVCVNSREAEATFRAVENQPYFFRVAGANGESGAFSITVDQNLQSEGEMMEGEILEGESDEGDFPPPANDEPAFAYDLYQNQEFQGTNVGATGTDMTTCAENDANDIWLKWLALRSGTYTINAHADFAMSLAAFPACGNAPCPDQQIACTSLNGSKSSNSLRIIMDAEKGKSYFMRVAGKSNATGPFSVTIVRNTVATEGETTLEGETIVDEGETSDGEAINTEPVEGQTDDLAPGAANSSCFSIS